MKLKVLEYEVRSGHIRSDHVNNLFYCCNLVNVISLYPFTKDHIKRHYVSTMLRKFYCTQNEGMGVRGGIKQDPPSKSFKNLDKYEKHNTGVPTCLFCVIIVPTTNNFRGKICQAFYFHLLCIKGQKSEASSIIYRKMRKLLISQFSRERKEKSKYTSAMYVSTNKAKTV